MLCGPNALKLAALSAAFRRPTKIILRTITLRRGNVICDRGDNVRQIYFPLTCVLSLVAVLTDGPA
jgi:hypothetical protein